MGACLTASVVQLTNCRNRQTEMSTEIVPKACCDVDITNIPGSNDRAYLFPHPSPTLTVVTRLKAHYQHIRPLSSSSPARLQPLLSRSVLVKNREHPRALLRREAGHARIVRIVHVIVNGIETSNTRASVGFGRAARRSRPLGGGVGDVVAFASAGVALEDVVEAEPLPKRIDC